MASKHFKPGVDTDPVMADVLKLGKPGERREGPATFVGRVGLQTGLGFAAENERLKAERADGMVLLRLDPKLIGRSEFANRHDRSLDRDDPALRQLHESIRLHGQDTPIRVRPALPDSEKEYEIVEGHRRHAVILELDRDTEGGYPILARLDAKASESKDLVLKMYRENAERADLSPFETGFMFQQWLSSGVFASQRAIGEAVGQSEATTSRYIAIAALPDFVLRAFGDPRVIALRWASDLTRICRQFPDDARRLAETLPTAPATTAEGVFAALMRVANDARASTPAKTARASEAIKQGNKVLFELSAREGRYGIRLGKYVDKKLHQPLRRDLREWLQAWLREHSEDSSK
jgi:ParB family chromosome partitioning protein